MTTTYDDSVLNFDLGFLQQPSSNTGLAGRLEKQRKAILIAKQKTIKTDSLIKKYYDKKELLETTEKSLFLSKEECKQVCIDYKHVSEKCETLENEVKIVQHYNQQLQQKLIDAENQYCGIQSHARQLELLVKEKESQIESLTLENNLEKANSKNFASTTSSLQRQNEKLLEDLCLLGKFLFGNKKIRPELQAVLQKYEKYINGDNEDSCNDSTGHSDDECDDFDGNVMSSENTQHLEKTEHGEKDQSSLVEVQEVIVVNIKSSENEDMSRCKLDEIDRYSDCSNEMASADTGRGSSLAFSDSEKCFRSPDYFVNDNHSPETISKTNLKTTATSPKLVTETIDIATSPIRIETPIIPIITVDKSVGPNEPVDIESINVRNSLHCYANDVKSSHILNDTSSQDTIAEQLSDVPKNNYLQVNPRNCDDDNSRDQEIEMILSKMRFNCELITPIPSSPCNSRNSAITNGSNYKPIQNESAFSKEDAFKLKEDYKFLKDNYSNVIKEIMLIKSMLKLNQLPLTEDINPHKEKESNTNISEENQQFENISVKNNMKMQKENYDIEDIEETMHVGNLTRTNENDDVEEVTQTQNENISDCGDLIEINDLVQLDDIENTQLEDVNDFNGLSLMNDEEATNSLTLSSQVTEELEYPIIIIEEQENTSEGIISRLEFEEDASQSQPETTNDVSCNSPEAIPSERKSPDLNLFSCNERIRKKMLNSNKLEKFRRKMIPKCKIQKERKFTSRNSQYKNQIGKLIRRTNLNNPKQKIAATDNSASLNDKRVYDNAVKVMSQIKSRRLKEKRNKPVFKSNRSRKSPGVPQNVPPLQVETCLETVPEISSESMADTIPKSSSEIKPISEKSTKQVSDCMDEISSQFAAIAAASKSKITKSSEKQDEQPGICAQLSEKPFDITDLLSKLTPKPVVKSLNQDINIKSIESNLPTELSQQHSKHSVKFMQPVILVDRIQDSIEVDRENNIRTNINTSPSLSPSVTTRSRSRCVEKPPLINYEATSPVSALNENLELSSKESRKLLKRVASDDNQEIENKRILRSSSRQVNFSENLNSKPNPNDVVESSRNEIVKSPNQSRILEVEKNIVLNDLLVNEKLQRNISISYDDMDIFDVQDTSSKTLDIDTLKKDHPKDSILCKMLEKHSVSKINFYPKKIADSVTNSVCKLIEDDLKVINELPPNETRTAMDTMVEKLQAWNVNQFLSGFMKYLQDPQRKAELYSKINSPPAPPMTKYEQILLYIIIKLTDVWSAVDVVDLMLNNIEYIMFKINRTPEFDVIESMAHFYAVMCRYFKMKTRLRLFMLDGMYCMQFKAIVLIRQCIDVWMHILPLAHMGIAKNPLVTCVVYLLHFYKCEDHFNRVQDIRNILNRKYSYQMAEWNETRILEMFRNAIYELKNIPVEKKMLRLSLIILAKRQGPRWCQKNIITNMLQPIIEKKDCPDYVQIFCVSMLGPLVKPYPVDMKVHCEIVMNMLLDMRKQNPSSHMEEAIFSSLIFMSKQNQNRVISALLSWHPEQVSPECHEVLRDFVREKPANAWKSILSKRAIVSEALKLTED